MAKSVDPDEKLGSAASHLGLHCLLRCVCSNTYSKYCTTADLSRLVLSLTVADDILLVLFFRENKTWYFM